MAEFNPEWPFRLPNPPNGGQLDDRGYVDGLSRLEGSQQPELANVWYWTNRLESALPEMAETLRRTRFTSRIAAGFIEELDGAFGVIVYTEAPGEADVFQVDQERSEIRVEDHSFPVVFRNATVERHWCTAPEVYGPTAARATCWVKSPSRGYEGWLLPRHAVSPLGATVVFSDGGNGHVIDHFGECIDAVVVTSTVRPMLHRTVACWPIVAGRHLLISDSVGSHQPLNVIDVDLNLGILSSIVFPIRFSTDWSGRPGQSGALIVDPIRGEPAGSYLGVIHPSVVRYVPPGMSAAPSSAGFAQSCYQLENAAGMEFYV